MTQGKEDPFTASQNVYDEGVERLNAQAPFSVLGIAFVVDKLGKGASMVLRYPTSPPATDAEDLFFRLPPRQMAKLFRPKASLCGRPMTLSVGGTVFCCYAVLMDDSGNSMNASTSNTDDGNSDDDSSDEHLLLFSVIVALSPMVQLSSIPITGWFEGQSNDYPDIHPSSKHHKEKSEHSKASSSSRARQASASFLGIRRVHLSLARLCRVLEREERRCRYVSIQTRRFQQIFNDLKNKWERARRESDNTGVTNLAATAGSSAGASPVSMSSKTAKGDRRHRRNQSIALYERNNAGAGNTRKGNASKASVGFQHTEAFQQEVLDIMMSATISNGGSGNQGDESEEMWQDHHGNLARELIQVFHALARNDNDFPPTPLASLSDRNGMVFINRHLTTSIEALAPPRSPVPMMRSDHKPVVRPYHTLLFPHSSAEELLDSLLFSESGSSRRLKQFLSTVHPQKCLLDIAMEANLPLQVTLDMARYMVSQGACVTASALSRNSVLVCHNTVDLIPKVSLDFTQTFGDALHVFHLVAYLTEGNRTLGNAMTAWKTSESDQWLRDRLELCPIPSKIYRSYLESTDGVETDMHLEALEELLYQMTIWLYSHQVLVQLEEYLVTTTASPASRYTINEDESTGGQDEGEHKGDSNLRLDQLCNDSLYKELLDSGCLEGTSLRLCSWQTGIDLQRLREFALQHPHLRLIVRAPDGLDD